MELTTQSPDERQITRSEYTSRIIHCYNHGYLTEEAFDRAMAEADRYPDDTELTTYQPPVRTQTNDTVADVMTAYSELVRTQMALLRYISNHQTEPERLTGLKPIIHACRNLQTQLNS